MFYLRFGLALLCLVLTPFTSKAQDSNSKNLTVTADTVTAPPAPALLHKLNSPRATMKTFLDAVNQDDLETAALCLDTSDLQAVEEAFKGKSEEYAYKLKDTIDRITRVQYFVISDNPDQKAEYSLNQGQTIIGQTAYSAAQSIIISRGNDNLWRFSAATVAKIDELYEQAQSREKVTGLVDSQVTKPPQVWLREQFPATLRERKIISLRLYQWICLGVLVFVGFGAEFIVRHALATDDLINIYVRGNNAAANDHAYYDDIFFDPAGANLSFPDVDLLQGDFNGDDKINTADYDIWRMNVFTGTTHAEGDFDLNGVVDLDDFGKLKEVIDLGGAVVGNIPEPGAVTLFAIAVGLGWLVGQGGVRSRSRN